MVDKASRGVDLSAAPQVARALLTLKEVAARLGCSTRWLHEHLKKHPLHDGQPTHRRIGRKFAFTEQDYGRLIETIAPNKNAVELGTRLTAGRGAKWASSPPLLSAAKEFDRTRKILAEMAQGGRRRRG